MPHPRASNSFCFCSSSSLNFLASASFRFRMIMFDKLLAFSSVSAICRCNLLISDASSAFLATFAMEVAVEVVGVAVDVDETANGTDVVVGVCAGAWLVNVGRAYGATGVGEGAV